MGFSRLVTLACHDLRTPLATVNGFAKTLLRRGVGDGNEAQRYVALIEAAGEEMSDLLDLLALAARIETGSYDPPLRQVDTLALVTTDDERIGVAGSGVPVAVDECAVRRSLAALASAALRHGEIEQVTWTVAARELSLDPVVPAAADVVTGKEPKDLGSLVARLAIEHAGGSLSLAGSTLRVVL
jgi:signal transduction histidine kinase